MIRVSGHVCLSLCTFSLGFFCASFALALSLLWRYSFAFFAVWIVQEVSVLEMKKSHVKKSIFQLLLLHVISVLQLNIVFCFSLTRMWALNGVYVNRKKHLCCVKSIWTCVCVFLPTFSTRSLCTSFALFISLFLWSVISFLGSTDCSGGFCYSREEGISCNEELLWWLVWSTLENTWAVIGYLDMCVCFSLYSLCDLCTSFALLISHFCGVVQLLPLQYRLYRRCLL